MIRPGHRILNTAMRSSTTPKCQKAERLAVNPRRNHVPETERKRVKRACNECNTRRVKCSGEQPCHQCSTAGRYCKYPVNDRKVFVPASEYSDLKRSKSLLDKCLADFLPDPAARQRYLSGEQPAIHMSGHDLGVRAIKDEELQHSPSSTSTSTSTVAVSPSQEPLLSQDQHITQTRRFIDTSATEGSLLQDRDGTTRWLGGSSGATFLDHLKKFMYTLKSSLLGTGIDGTQTDTYPGSKFLASRGQYQTSDSQLLFMPTADSINQCSSLSNLDWNIAGSLLNKVDEYLQNSSSNWPCGGIHYFGDLTAEAWLGQLNEQARMGTSTPRRESAFYEAAFALGTIYSLTVASSRREGHLGEMFFARTRKILGDPMDISQYSFRDVRTLAMMAMYMAEMNRRDNAYVYLSHATIICCMFGGVKGSFSNEHDRRIVWTLFCLSRDLSCLMGRPLLLPDEAFLLPLPEPVPGLPSPYGLLAHIKLSKIAGYIVSNTYNIAPRESFEPSQDHVPQEVAKPLRMLYEWRDELPPDLQIPLDIVSGPQFIENEDQTLPTDRALCMLHMKWNQLIILTLRPLFFIAVKSSIGGDLVNKPRDMLEHPHSDSILKCSAAARRNLRLARHVLERCSLNSSPGKLVMLDLHHIFNAAVVLLLHQMVFSNVVNTDTMAIRAARHIFEKEAEAECLPPEDGMGSGTATGYASDCVGVLNDLAALVACIRPLRFKGSEHANAGVVDVSGWASPMGPDVCGASVVVGVSGGGGGGASGSGGGGGGGGGGEGAACSTGTLGSPIMLVSEEQLAANLSLKNPFAADGMHSIHQQLMMQAHTNQKELERWVQEGMWAINCMPDIGEYTGM